MELIELMFKSFWHFVGFTILLTGLSSFIISIWNGFWRYWTIRNNRNELKQKEEQ